MTNELLFREDWIKALEEVETKLQLLSPPEGDPEMSITERGDMLRKHYENTKVKHLEVATELQKTL
jgi:hypothetical protein